MSDDLKEFSVDDFRNQGYLQEVNRRFLHPLGLALSVTGEKGDDGEFHATGFGAIWDYRDDPEGIYFAGDYANLKAHANSIDAAWKSRRAKRKAKLGYMVQPVEAAE